VISFGSLIAAGLSILNVSFLQRRRSRNWGGRQSSAYSVEKLQNFPGGKFIFDVTISKN